MEISFFLLPYDFDFVQNLSGLKGYDFRSPQLNWVWSTFYRLKQAGVTNIKLVKTLPTNGVVVIASNQLELTRKLPKDVFLISTVADSPPRFYSHVNVSQNPLQHFDYPNVLSFPKWVHIPHWPQPNLIARDTARGNSFQNISFFGNDDQIDPELLTADFAKKMLNKGFDFRIVNREFNDYTTTDGVIAIRSFSKMPYYNKPFSKLINAWRAGVPAVVGPESSFASIKKSDLDFLVVQSKSELIETLVKLKDNVTLRHKMVENGFMRATEFTDETILTAWKELLFQQVPHYYNDWKSKTPVGRAAFYFDMFASRYSRSVRKRIQHKVKGTQ